MTPEPICADCDGFTDRLTEATIRYVMANSELQYFASSTPSTKDPDRYKQLITALNEAKRDMERVQREFTEHKVQHKLESRGASGM